MDQQRRDEIRAYISDAVRRERIKRCLTQQQLADLLEVPQSWVSNVESGIRKLELSEAHILANQIGVEIAIFLPCNRNGGDESIS